MDNQSISAILSRRDATPIFLGAPIPPSTTNPSLMANLVCRVLFGLLANLACLVPLGLLCRNGEFAAVIFILNVIIQNIRNIVNALIWHNDDMQSWWPGYGLCDIDPYLHNIAVGLYSTCLLAIMRNLAIQVGSLRAHPLTQKEKRRRNLIQALIVFPLPLLQIALTFPLASQRYWIGTLVGCTWAPAIVWPYIVFDVLPPAVVSLVTAGYAVLTYFRFRQVAKTTQSALSSNRAATLRNQRTKRRLYLMVISILVPFLPMVIAIAVANIVLTGPLQPFDYNAIHHHAANTVPWDAIVYQPSTNILWPFMNNCYIPIASAVPIFAFFGMTKDAVNCYRVMLLRIGFGRLYPSLHQEYNPDTRASGSNSQGSSSFYTTSAKSSRQRTKSSASTPLNAFSSSSNNESGSNLNPPSRSLGFPIPTSSSNTHDPLTCRPPPPLLHHIQSEDIPIQLPHRNPFLFRTRLNFSFPFSLSLFRSSGSEPTSAPTPLERLQSSSPFQQQPPQRSGSDEEAQLFSTESSIPSSSQHQPSRNSSRGDNAYYGAALLPAVLHSPGMGHPDGQQD